MNANAIITLMSMSLIGLIAGRLLNVVLFRFSFIFHPHATALNCPHCQRPHNLMMLRGQCTQCKRYFSFRYPFFELLSVTFVLFSLYHFGFSWRGLAALPFIWVLIALSFIDLKYQILPDQLTLPMIGLGLMVNTAALYTSLVNAVIGAIIGYLSLWLVDYIYQCLTKRRGIGQGDFKLLAMLGAWLGWQLLPFIIIIAAVSGLMMGGIYLLWTSQSRRTPIPFGPFLAFSGMIHLMYGKMLLNLYLSFVWG